MKGELLQIITILNGDWISQEERIKWDVVQAKKIDEKWQLVIEKKEFNESEVENG
jgi:hypothetical protein